ncbi:SDR family oxidoreductase [Frondihabitans australicus]|uniref:Uncharacterized protein YbjT (DUF2867 family) n=1 Tax=Frondihabitans australicus TaxID=386892 RepID=A0A495II04_9MICO|nr:SDR family oxidoreductase [Frondihabitans australicus]RKR75048.1 uncharacterized protein YbjT (DUF2867 family) [Frondihabitans australicus]
MRFAIAGGTGTVGHLVVEAARRPGHDTVVLSRATGVDLVTGDALVERLDGVDAVIDTSSTSTLNARASVAFFTAVTRNLLEAEQVAGAAHHVALSIVGADETAAGYYAGKAAQERLVAESGRGWTLLRTTQFHEFAAQTAGRSPVLGLRLVPAMRSQPVAAAEVADELVRLAAGAPQGLVPDLAGPAEERMADLVARYAEAVGLRGRIVEVPLPGATGKAMRGGALLPGPTARLGVQTFGEWLDGVARGRR